MIEDYIHSGAKFAAVSATVAEMKAAGGEWVVRNTKFTSLDGPPPERLVIIKFDSVECQIAPDSDPVSRPRTTPLTEPRPAARSRR